MMQQETKNTLSPKSSISIHLQQTLKPQASVKSTMILQKLVKQKVPPKNWRNQTKPMLADSMTPGTQRSYSPVESTHMNTTSAGFLSPFDIISKKEAHEGTGLETTRFSDETLGGGKEFIN